MIEVGSEKGSRIFNLGDILDYCLTISYGMIK